MKTKEDFIALCEQNFKEEFSKIQKEEVNRYLKGKTKYYLEFIVLSLVIAFFIYYIYSNGLSIYYKIAFIVLSCIFIVGLIIVNYRLMKKEKRKVCYLLNALIYDQIVYYLTNDDYVYHNDVEISKDDFNKMNLFNLNYLKYSGNNLTVANYNDKKFVMCDVFLYDLISRIKNDSYYSKASNTIYNIYYHYKDRVDIFKGLYYETTINRDNDKYIYMIPNNLNDKFVRKNIYHYISFTGVKIELENIDFSERYSVFSVDEIKSRYVLSLTLMEKINQLDKMIKNKKYFVFKSDGRVGIFIDGFQIDKLLFREFDLKKKVTNEYLLKFYRDVKKIFDIAGLLEDINTYK